MLQKENSLCPDWHFKVNRFYDFSPFTIEQGKTYVLFKQGSAVGRELLKKSQNIETNLNLYYRDYKIFRFGFWKRSRKLHSFLRKYNLDDEEIYSLCSEFKLDRNKRADMFGLFHQTIFLINICLKNSPILIYHTAGRDFDSCQFIYNYIVNKINSAKEKSAIIIEDGSRSFKKEYIDLLPQEALRNYKEWYFQNINQ
jgi:hypothetical protein